MRGKRGAYPVLPMVPVAVVDLAVKDPALSPEQYDKPEGDEQVREAHEAPGLEVDADTMQHAQCH